MKINKIILETMKRCIFLRLLSFSSIMLILIFYIELPMVSSISLRESDIGLTMEQLTKKVSGSEKLFSQDIVDLSVLARRAGSAGLVPSGFKVTEDCVQGIIGFPVVEGEIKFVTGWCKECIKDSSCQNCSCLEKKVLILGNGFCQSIHEPIVSLSVDPTICSIGKYDFHSNCSSYEFVNEHWLWMKDSKTVSFTQDFDLIQVENLNKNDLHCNGSCSSDDCSKGTCSGTERFCANFGCLTNSGCYCDLGSPSYIVRSDGLTQKPLCFGVGLFPVKKVKMIKKRSVALEGSVSIKCERNNLLITSMTDNINKVKICISPFCELRDFSGTFMNYRMTYEQTISKSDAKVEFWVNGESDSSLTLSAACTSNCPVIDCYFCKEVLLNMHCIGSFQKFMLFCEILTMLIILLIVSSLCLNVIKLLILLWVPVRILVKLLRLPFRLFRKAKPRARRYYDSLMEEGTEVEVIDLQKAQSERRVGRKAKVFNFLSVVLVFSFFKISSCCSETSSFTININDCSYSGNGIESCLVTSKTRLALSPVGQDSCFTILNSEGKAIANLIINTKDVRIRCKREELYHTFNPDVKCPSHFNCARAGLCFGDDPCKFDKDREIETLSSVNKNVGWTRCVRANGCAGNGCGLCADSCIFYRVALTNPSGRTYSLFSCPTWEYTVDISARLLTVTDSSSGSISLTVGSKENLLGFKVSLVSISSPPKPVLSKCFSESEGRVAIVPCNLRSEYSSGKIGEVQCPSSSSAKMATRSCYTMESGIQIRKLAQSVTCSGSFVDVETVFSKNLLPIKTDGFSLIVKDGEVEALESGTSMLEIQIESNQFQLSSRTDLNKCFLRVEEVKGCYSCLTAASITFIGKTDFGSATAQVICGKTGTSFPLALSHTENRVVKIVAYHQQEVDEKCIVRCPAGDTEVHIKGTLSYVENAVSVKSSESESRIPVNSVLEFAFLSELMSNSFFRIIFPSFLVVFVVLVVLVSVVNPLRRTLKRD